MIYFRTLKTFKTGKILLSAYQRKITKVTTTTWKKAKDFVKIFYMKLFMPFSRHLRLLRWSNLHDYTLFNLSKIQIKKNC